MMMMMRMMSQKITSMSLLCVACVALIAASGCREMPSEQPPIHLNPNMDDQEYLEAQEVNKIAVDGRYVVADHRAMRSYMAHTIPTDVDWALRDSGRYYRGFEQVAPDKKQYMRDIPPELSWSPAELSAEYGKSLTPVKWKTTTVEENGQKKTVDVSREAVFEGLLNRGEERYNIYCTPCHDMTGSGKGSVIIRSNNALQPPTYHDAQRRAYPVGKIYDVITNGYGTMPSLKAQIPVRDRWAISVYVKALQLANNVQQAEVPAEFHNKNWGTH